MLLKIEPMVPNKTKNHLTLVKTCGTFWKLKYPQMWAFHFLKCLAFPPPHPPFFQVTLAKHNKLVNV